MRPGFVVRWARSDEDLAAVESLQRGSFAEAWGRDAFSHDPRREGVGRIYLMRAPTGEPVAYCACWLIVDELHVNSLAVAASWRRQGLATDLWQAVMLDAMRDGARSATLEVRESNQAARALYERLGFRVEAVRRNYYQGPREDALILWNRSLGQPE